MAQSALPFKIGVKNFEINGLQYSVALTPELYSDVILTGGDNFEDIDAHDTVLTPNGCFKVILVGENIGTHSFRMGSDFGVNLQQVIPRGLMVEIIKMMQEYLDIDNSIALYEHFDKELFDFLKFKNVTHLRPELEELDNEEVKQHLPAFFILTCHRIAPDDGITSDYMPIDSEQVADMLEGVSKMLFYVALRPSQYVDYYKHLQFLEDLNLEAEN